MRKKRKGFTLVELLVVIAIIALLMGILMPALARVRAIAHRLVCGTNLSGLGKAMLIYANDYEEELPQAGLPGSNWASSITWNAPTRAVAYGGGVTVSSSLYLLIKYVDVGVNQFLCKGTDTKEFKPTGLDLIDLWDFGPSPIDHCSYSYHSAYGSPFALNLASSQPGMAVAADRNPWLDPAANPGGFKWNGNPEEQKAGNAIAHGGEGQNVVFLDSHVAYEKRSFCGVMDDNIYTYCAKNGVIQQGTPPTTGGDVPLHREDSLLLNEGEGVITTTTTKRLRCFPADTPVWVDGKMVPFLKVVPGQELVGKLGGAAVIDPADAVLVDGKLVSILDVVPRQKVGELDSTAVIEKIEEHGVGTYDCYDMVLESGNSITIVHSHYFLTVSGKWVSIENLTSGSKLQSLNGPISITSVVKRAMPFVGNAYNLKVKGSNCYFVGKDGVVAVDCSKLPGE